MTALTDLLLAALVAALVLASLDAAPSSCARRTPAAQRRRALARLLRGRS